MTAEEIVVGRSSKAGLLIPDRMLSREHARFLCQGGEWSVEDLGSHNGTFLNGVRLQGRMKLRAGDSLGLGGSTITGTIDAAVSGEEWYRFDLSAGQSVIVQRDSFLCAQSSVEVNIEFVKRAMAGVDRMEHLNIVLQDARTWADSADAKAPQVQRLAEIVSGLSEGMHIVALPGSGNQRPAGFFGGGG